jgi:hypothetical protein
MTFGRATQVPVPFSLVGIIENFSAEFKTQINMLIAMMVLLSASALILPNFHPVLWDLFGVIKP